MKGECRPRAGNHFLLKVKQYSTTPGRNLHLNSVKLLTGSQFGKKLAHMQLFLSQGQIKLLKSIFNLTECLWWLEMIIFTVFGDGKMSLQTLNILNSARLRFPFKLSHCR